MLRSDGVPGAAWCGDDNCGLVPQQNQNKRRMKVLTGVGAVGGGEQGVVVVCGCVGYRGGVAARRL